MWTHRILLEASLYPENAFLTLTYADDPVTLEPDHLAAFMKALRKRLEPKKVRFYAVGEYGEKNNRPHFHVALFNHPSCRTPRRRVGTCSCSACQPIVHAWVDASSIPRGFIYNLPLEPGSARYIARYVVKKMTRTDDPRLGNRHPEFARMSNRRGIGHGVVAKIAETITRYNLLTPAGDVPVTLRHGSTQLPLGRYLRQQVRKHLNLDPRTPHVLSPEASYAHFHSEENALMRAVQKAALADKENPSLKAHTLNASKVKRGQIETRQRLFNTKGKL